jgi:predicted XRE-type DNA-binding protein
MYCVALKRQREDVEERRRDCENALYECASKALGKEEAGEEGSEKMTKRNEPTHMTYGSVLDDLGFSPEKAAVLKMKAEFHAALLRSARNYTQKELQTILKEPQPRVSEFMNGKIASVSMEKMTLYAYRLGAKPRIHLESARTHARVAAKRIGKSGRNNTSGSKHSAVATAS